MKAGELLKFFVFELLQQILISGQWYPCGQRSYLQGMLLHPNLEKPAWEGTDFIICGNVLDSEDISMIGHSKNYHKSAVG